MLTTHPWRREPSHPSHPLPFPRGQSLEADLYLGGIVTEMRPAGEQPRDFDVIANGVRLHLVEWAGEGAPIFLVHATGFHARIWDEVARRLPGRRVLSIDTRGHGTSDKPKPPYIWDYIGADITDVLRVLDLRDVVMVGHSMGGHSAVYAAVREPSRFAGLMLIDPTIGRNTDVPRAEGAPTSGVERRRNDWGSPDEMIERFQSRFPFELWQPQVLDDYARYGLLPAASGEGFVLACPPAVEAAVYGGRGAGEDIWLAVPKITAPVRVLRAREPMPGVQTRGFETSPTSPELASTFPHGSDRVLSHLTHFIPMQDPGLVAEEIAGFTDRVMG